MATDMVQGVGSLSFALASMAISTDPRCGIRALVMHV